VIPRSSGSKKEKENNVNALDVYKTRADISPQSKDGAKKSGPPGEEEQHDI
jgi:hypothetical protein